MNFTNVNYKSILVIATRQIGDVLVTTPLIREIRARWPDARLDVLAYENTAGMLVGNPDISKVIETSEHPTVGQYADLIRKLFRAYDFAFVTQGSDRAHIYGLLFSRSRCGVVPSRLLHSWWKRLFSKGSVTIDYFEQHAVAEKLRLIAPQNAHDLFSRGVGVIGPAPRPLPDQLTDRLSSRYVVFHATPMWRYKRWPQDNWIALGLRLVRLGYKVVLTGSASRQDLDYNDLLCFEIGEEACLNTSGMLDLGQVRTLLHHADLYVGVDTSVSRLAAAIGVPTFVLFGPTPPTNFAPWPMRHSTPQPYRKVALVQTTGNVTVIQGEETCVPCRMSGCENHFDSASICLEGLSVERVYQQVVEKLLR